MPQASPYTPDRDSFLRHSLGGKGPLVLVEDQAPLSSAANHVLLLFTFARCKFFSLTETPEDYTIIVDEEGFLGKCRRVPLCYPAWEWRRKTCHLSLRL